jgi:hypothetical protein
VEVDISGYRERLSYIGSRWKRDKNSNSKTVERKWVQSVMAAT